MNGLSFLGALIIMASWMGFITGDFSLLLGGGMFGGGVAAEIEEARRTWIVAPAEEEYE